MTEEELREKIENIIDDAMNVWHDVELASEKILTLPEIRDGLKLLKMWKNGELPAQREHGHKRKEEVKQISFDDHICVYKYDPIWPNGRYAWRCVYCGKTQ